MSRIERKGAYWSGYLLEFGTPVPENPQMRFHPDAFYNLALLNCTQVPEVGELWQVKKDAQGIFVLVKSDRVIPEDYEWHYTVAKPEYQYVMNPNTGQSEQILTVYPLLSVSAGHRKEARDGVHAAPVGIVKRTKRPASAAHDESIPGTNPGTPDQG